MKKQFLIISFLFSMSASASQVFLPEHVFAPVGFDDNDNAQVILYGNFPDTCYQAGPAEATIYGDEIHIRNVATRWDSGVCDRAPVPWITTVNLGALNRGTYSIYVENPRGGFTPFVDLVVSASLTGRMDDFRYAYVKSTFVSESTRFPTLTINGAFNLTCMEIAEVRTSESSDAIVVQPIVRLRTDVPCGHPYAPIPFSYRVKLRPRTDRLTLVHVRSVNGQAINQVIGR